MTHTHTEREGSNSRESDSHQSTRKFERCFWRGFLLGVHFCWRGQRPLIQNTEYIPTLQHKVLKKLFRPHDNEIFHHHADEPSLAGVVCLFMSVRISKDETLQLVREPLMLPAHKMITRIPPASTSIRDVDRGTLDDGIHTLLCVHTASQALPASSGPRYTTGGLALSVASFSPRLTPIKRSQMLEGPNELVTRQAKAHAKSACWRSKFARAPRPHWFFRAEARPERARHMTPHANSSKLPVAARLLRPASSRASSYSFRARTAPASAFPQPRAHWPRRLPPSCHSRLHLPTHVAPYLLLVDCPLLSPAIYSLANPAVLGLCPQILQCWASARKSRKSCSAGPLPANPQILQCWAFARKSCSAGPLSSTAARALASALLLAATSLLIITTSEEPSRI